MRLKTSKLWTLSCTGLLALTLACGDDKGEEAEAAEASTETGDGDGDDEVGDDGAPGDSDGEPGDGDGEAGDGDGDGDGEEGDGDGDGEPNPECFDLDEEECGMTPDCQLVTGSPLKANGPGSPCLEPAEFLGCIGMQGCDDALTWFCGQGNKQWRVNDSCGAEGMEQCEGPEEPVEACM